MKQWTTLSPNEMLEKVKFNSLQYMQTQANNLLNPHRYYLSKEAQKRLRWLHILYYECDDNVTKAANKIGISREWLSKIKSVFERSSRNPKSLEPQSRAPNNTDKRNRIPQTTENVVIKVRDNSPGWGKEKIARILIRDYDLKVHPSTVNRYLHKHKRISLKVSDKNKRAWLNKKQRENQNTLQPTFKIKYRPPKKIKDYKPGALAEKDMKFVLKSGQFTNLEKYGAKENFYYQHTMIDSFTRFRVFEIVQDAESKTAVIAYQKANQRLPFPIACFNTDNGGENEKDFSSQLQKETIFHFYSDIGTPTDNPRVERSHLTDDLEFYKLGNFNSTFKELKQLLKKWEHTYNYERPHQALGYLTPMEFYTLWKHNPKKAYQITNQYQTYLAKQRRRLANSRRLKKKEQIENLMKFIDAKLSQKSNLKSYQSSLVKCELCSWT